MSYRVFQCRLLPWLTELVKKVARTSRVLIVLVATMLSTLCQTEHDVKPKLGWYEETKPHPEFNRGLPASHARFAAGGILHGSVRQAACHLCASGHSRHWGCRGGADMYSTSKETKRKFRPLTLCPYDWNNVGQATLDY